MKLLAIDNYSTGDNLDLEKLIADFNPEIRKFYEVSERGYRPYYARYLETERLEYQVISRIHPIGMYMSIAAELACSFADEVIIVSNEPGMNGMYYNLKERGIVVNVISQEIGNRVFEIVKWESIRKYRLSKKVLQTANRT